jgi:hypothetical protein
VLVHLFPAPVVARVATLAGTRRAGDGWLRREVSVAGFLDRAGAPVIAPSRELDPGPHTLDGVSFSFWDHVEEVATRSTPPRQAGACTSAMTTSSTTRRSWSPSARWSRPNAGWRS